MSTKHLAIGLDGADLSLVEQLGPETLPHLHGLMARGAYAPLHSVQPPATLPNWTTFLTGANPGHHGVFDFTTREGYGVRFTAGTVRELPTVVGRLDRQGHACASLFFPATYPPEALAHGVYISGWDAPVAFEADASFVWPRALHGEITRRFGPMRFDDVDEFDSERPGWHAALPDALCARIERRVALTEWLLKRQDWQLFAVYFGESDTAAHHLWALFDPHSPRRPEPLPDDLQGGLKRVYAALDAAVGRLLAAAGEGVEITLVSDHGFGGASDKVCYLNRALETAGLLTFRDRNPVTTVVGRAKELALTRLPPKLRERVFRAAGAVLPGLLESRARYGAIDMSRTLAFSDELNYFPAVHLNLRGREPQGVVAPENAEAIKAQVEAALLALRDPWTNAPVVKRVMRRERLFHGPWVNRAPDLLLELHLDEHAGHGYSYNLMPSAGAPAGTGAFRRLGPEEYLGRKGRSLQGSHRSHGLWIAAGPQVRAVGRIQAEMADATATLLARMGVSVPGQRDGRVLTDALADSAGAQPGRESEHTPTGQVDQARQNHPVGQTGERPEAPATAPPRAGARQPSRAEQARVEARLRKLGYIE